MKRGYMWHDSFVQILEKAYVRLRQKNAQYSRRAFAKKLGVSSGMLSDVANGKARFTKKRAGELLDRLELSPKDRARMLVLLGKSSELIKDLPASDDFFILTDWINRSIMFAFDISKFPMSVAYLSEHLGLSITDIEKRIATLVDLGLLTRDADGQISRTKVIWRVPQENTKEFSHQLYAINLDLAKKAIKHVPAPERDFTTITFAGNSDQIDKVRGEIQELYERVFAVMEEPPTDQVYQLSVFLHPTHVKGLAP